MHPKQWKRGGGQQTMSFGVSHILSPMKKPLLRIERWVRQAALGREVVPDVNWMLIVSWISKGSSGITSLLLELVKLPSGSMKGVVALREEVSIRSWELSTRIMFLSEGADADSNFDADKSGAICFNSVMFSRGGLYERFVSVPIIRCAAERCESADMTCGELNAGFRGTCHSHTVSALLFVFPFP
jgi:hypothetical protein